MSAFCFIKWAVQVFAFLLEVFLSLFVGLLWNNLLPQSLHSSLLDLFFFRMHGVTNKDSCLGVFSRHPRILCLFCVLCFFYLEVDFSSEVSAKKFFYSLGLFNMHEMTNDKQWVMLYSADVMIWSSHLHLHSHPSHPPPECITFYPKKSFCDICVFISKVSEVSLLGVVLESGGRGQAGRTVFWFHGEGLMLS